MTARSVAHYVDQGHSVASARVLASLTVGDTVYYDGEPATVTALPRNGFLRVRMHRDGIEGTVAPELLRRYAPL